MTDNQESNEKNFNILVYGIEKKGLSAPSDNISTRNFSLTFESFKTVRRFNEFDAVIVFQGVFERFERKSDYMSSYLTHACDNDELDKRKKEAQLLIDQGGLLCFLLNEGFIDRDDGRDFSGSDLTKYHLNYSNFYRENHRKRIANIDIKSDEFRQFLGIYGAASSNFHHYNNHIDWRVIANVSQRAVGMIINRNEYFIPTLIPDNRPEVLSEYFNILATGITSTNNKLQTLIPGWLEKFSFKEEDELMEERDTLAGRISEIDDRHTVLNQYKSALSLSGDDLVGSVTAIFRSGFGIKVDSEDEYREDIKLLDENNDPMCLCEIKGTNRGIKREHINQADSHRERSGFDPKKPALLIMNTHIKNSRSVEEKNQEIANEQIIHSVKMNVLILRTLDLLELLKLYLSSKITAPEIKVILTSNCGWLRVNNDQCNIIMGTHE